jgi:hypothetical protein
MQDVWARETGRPLKIVAGDNWLAGLVGLTAKDKPSIFTSGNYAYAPWITPARLKKQGALVVWNEAVHPMPPALAPLIDSHRVGREHFNWRRSKKHGDLVISYGIIPPD